MKTKEKLLANASKAVNDSRPSRFETSVGYLQALVELRRQNITIAGAKELRILMGEDVAAWTKDINAKIQRVILAIENGTPLD